MQRGSVEWRRDCAGCGFLASDLAPAIGGRGGALDEAERGSALEPLRRRNFFRLLVRIDKRTPPAGKRLLDVGCAHGWFLEIARERGYEVQGIEPDRDVGELARRKGLEVRTGYFPDDLGADERFDLIVFNDVLEHLPDPRQAVRNARDRLHDDGLLVVNLPSSRGALYRVAAALCRVGIRAPHERLWQAGFPSPHLSYFHPDGLARLARDLGLREVERGELPLFDVATLWSRLRYDRALGWPAAALAWTALAAVYPALRWLPSDISYQIFASPGGEAGAAPQQPSARPHPR